MICLAVAFFLPCGLHIPSIWKCTSSSDRQLGIFRLTTRDADLSAIFLPATMLYPYHLVLTNSIFINTPRIAKPELGAR